MDEKEKARQVGIGFSKVANVLDAHRKIVSEKLIAIGIDITHVNFYGSPMCFANSFTVLFKSKEELEGKDYDYGADLIAKECGLKNKFELRYWARDYPKLWGNEHGYDMFCTNIAYGIAEGDNNTLTLDALIAHLRSVSSNCASV